MTHLAKEKESLEMTKHLLTNHREELQKQSTSEVEAAFSELHQ